MYTTHIHTYENDNLKAIIVLRDEMFVVDFYEGKDIIGTIEYPNNSISYVTDAATNYVNGIFKKRDVIKCAMLGN